MSLAVACIGIALLIGTLLRLFVRSRRRPAGTVVSTVDSVVHRVRGTRPRGRAAAASVARLRPGRPVLHRCPVRPGRASPENERIARMQPEGDELAPQADEAPAVSPASGVPTSGIAYRGAAGDSAEAMPPPSASGSTYRSNNGSGSVTALAALWNDNDRQRIRGRWQELQMRFLDDPHLVAGEAERLVQEAVSALSASLDARRSQLHQQRAARGLDTENLRASLRDYREFLDRILSL